VAALVQGPSLLVNLKHLYKAIVPESVRRFMYVAVDAYTNPLSWAIVMVVFIAERVIPATPQRVLSRGLVQDFVWYSADTTFRLTMLPLYLGVLKALFDRHLGVLTIPVMSAWPLGARASPSRSSSTICSAGSII